MTDSLPSNRDRLVSSLKSVFDFGKILQIDRVAVHHVYHQAIDFVRC